MKCMKSRISELGKYQQEAVKNLASEMQLCFDVANETGVKELTSAILQDRRLLLVVERGESIQALLMKILHYENEIEFETAFIEYMSE